MNVLVPFENERVLVVRAVWVCDCYDLARIPPKVRQDSTVFEATARIEPVSDTKPLRTK